jgi:hypothetical protein
VIIPENIYEKEKLPVCERGLTKFETISLKGFDKI